MELKIAESMEFGGTYRIYLVSLTNIDIGQNSPQNINNSIFGHTFFGGEKLCF